MKSLTIKTVFDSYGQDTDIGFLARLSNKNVSESCLIHLGILK